jgi:aspartyl/asparaginyl-tRNA synthetase
MRWKTGERVKKRGEERSKFLELNDRRGFSQVVLHLAQHALYTSNRRCVTV